MKFYILLLSIIISVIPIILIGYLFYKRDTIKEPKRLLNNLFISGIFSGIIVVFISIFGLILFPIFGDVTKINNYLILFLYSYIFIALIEESSKLLMIYKVSYNSKEFDQTYDIILYSVFVGLGFACFENIIYVLGNPSIETALLRSITAVPAHTCFQIIMGYFLYLSKYKEKRENILFGLIITVFLHGTYDFLIFIGIAPLVIIDILFLIILMIYSNNKVKELIKVDKNNIQTSLCPRCGTKINYLYCPNCGYKKNN